MTTTFPNQTPKAGAQVIYDTAAVVPVQGADANHSMIITMPGIIQIDALPAATSVEVFEKIHWSASWVSSGVTVATVDGATIVRFANPANFVQLVRTGAGAVKAYAQAAR